MSIDLQDTITCISAIGGRECFLLLIISAMIRGREKEGRCGGVVRFGATWTDYGQPIVVHGVPVTMKLRSWTSISSGSIGGEKDTRTIT